MGNFVFDKLADQIPIIRVALAEQITDFHDLLVVDDNRIF
ncbi:hypothetical protein SDC9_191513 [bioreactor metagenome]|uniref:Uncharacterized protein n=1 Tax=bioreactor metagenome TaxID=1076179 RepID=A0A645HZN7_9ZZZZ